MKKSNIQNHKCRCGRVFALLLSVLALVLNSQAAIIFQTTSPYHHLRVADEGDLRTLYFDDAMETRMSLQDPTKGHFEYTEYFHMPWLWNTQMTSVLMIGLGGGSTQRSFEYYYPKASVQSVEIDPVVLKTAEDYFHFRQSDRQKVQVEDGRVFLRRIPAKYDLIILDAYVQGRYGSGIPQHLVTREFFELVRNHLSTNGLVAYNVIGTPSGWRADIIGAMYRTLKAVFPQVYYFPAKTSLNVVFIGTRTAFRPELAALRQRAAQMVADGRLKLPGFRERLEGFQTQPPPTAARSPILTDDFAPVEGLVGGGK